MYHPMNIFGFGVDPSEHSPLVILKDDSGDRSLPLWLDPLQALALLSGVILQNGASSDLLSVVIEKSSLQFEEVSIDDFHDGNPVTSVRFSGCEPVPVGLVDALLLALRRKVPVMVAEHALEKAAVLGNEPQPENEERTRHLELLEKLMPRDMGKYPM